MRRFFILNEEAGVNSDLLLMVVYAYSVMRVVIICKLNILGMQSFMLLCPPFIL